MEVNKEEDTLRQLEKDIGTEIIPGTEIMTDIGSYRFVKAGSRDDQVLVPQPSDDPRDPLNWSRFWKTLVISLSTAVSFAQGMGPLALAPMFPQLMQAFDHSLNDTIQFTGVCILVLGFSNFIWVPIQTAFGRRPVLIASTLICLVSCIWRAVATDYASFMGACVLNGIGAGPAETAEPQIIADVLFLHERGGWNTLYFTFYFGALTVGPIIAGPMALHSGWRSFWWLNVAMHGVILVLLFFLFPETKWDRTKGKSPVTNALDGKSTSTNNIEVASQTHQPIVANKKIDSSSDTFPKALLHQGKPSKEQFGFLTLDQNPLRAVLLDIFIPWKLFLFPIVEFSSFVVSWSASSFLTINLVQSQAFAAAPYLYDSQNIGFMNFAVLFGIGVGLLTNGWLSDKISASLTKRNRGIREPEMRLPALLPFVLVMLLGNFIVAFGWQRKWPWEVIVIIGYTCAGIQVAAIPAIVTTYSIDSYKPVAGSIMVAITVNKNLWGYGISKFITSWITQSGYLPPIMLNMCLNFLFCSFGLLFYYKGKSFRRWTRNDKVHSL